MRLSTFLSVIVATSPGVMLNAQTCNKGPGSAFGVTAYVCTECRVEWDSGTEQQYTFRSAPVVLRTTGTSALKRQDVIEAVDGRPITTKEGAELFVRPQAGSHTLTVRRNRSTTEVKVTAGPCGADQPTTDRLEPPSAYELPFKITQVNPAQSESQSRFGFAVACIPSCTKVKLAGESTAYWKYDGYPLIAAVRKGGPAERAGLRNGDVVTKVDGFSVLEEKGALQLFRSDGATTLTITVRRDGNEVQTILEAKPVWQHLLDREGQHVWFDSAFVTRKESLLSVRVKTVDDRENRAFVRQMDFVCATRSFRITAREYKQDGKFTGDRQYMPGDIPWVHAAPGLFEGLILDALCRRFGPGKFP